MNRAPLWFERKFDFTFPVEVYPNLCARLRGTPARLEETMQGAARDLLLAKPAGKWSAQEHAGHLVDLAAPDLSNQKTHQAQHNQRSLNEILADFRSARLGLLNRVEKINPALFARAIAHPRLQTPMRLVDHLYFVAEHDDHHLAHIWALLNQDPERK